MLTIKNLTVRYKRKDKSYLYALKEFDLELRQGEILGIVGESGSGKTTLAKAILNLLPPNAEKLGEIVLGGKILDNKNINDFRGTHIGYITQSYYTSLSNWFRVGTQFDMLYKSSTRMTKSERKSKVLGLLQQLNFSQTEELLEKYPFELSGGMIQRIIIAMAVSQNPLLLIADEPTSSIDAITKTKLLTLLRDINKKTKVSIILISHDLSLVHNFTDKLIITYKGYVLESGLSKEIYNRPQHPYTELLINSKPDFIKTQLKEKKMLRNNDECKCIFFKYCPSFNNDCRKFHSESVNNINQCVKINYA